jgi:protein-S-isoprenylcysteine O-methyltransferase Ste14
MYLGLGLSLSGWVCLMGSAAGMWLLIPLAGVLMGKARVEETHLLDRHPSYGDYSTRTGRFLPGLGKRSARG